MRKFGKKPYGCDFWECLDMSGGEDSCWEWKFSCDTQGYGNVRFRGRKDGKEIS